MYASSSSEKITFSSTLHGVTSRETVHRIYLHDNPRSHMNIIGPVRASLLKITIVSKDFKCCVIKLLASNSRLRTEMAQRMYISLTATLPNTHVNGFH
jgi:hypothetical protein